MIFASFFIWGGMNEKFQSHLIHITNKSKPGISDINDNIFEATERYLKQLDTSNAKNLKHRNAGFSQPKQSDHLDSYTAAVNIKTDTDRALCVHYAPQTERVPTII